MELRGSENPALVPIASTVAAAPTITYSDRSTGLVIFGILEMIAGALAALAIPFALLGIVMARRLGTGMPRTNGFVGVLSYAFAAAVLLTLGIGAIQAKRWARALNLIISWVWLIGGAVMTIGLTILLPRVMRPALLQASQRQGMQGVSTGVMAVFLTLTIVFVAVFFVVLPLAFLLFYRSPNVEQTCKHRDPVDRWTDSLPLPVLAYGLMAGSAGVYMLVLSFSTPIFPFFGKYLTGIAGASAMLVFAVIDAYIAYSFFRLNVRGWWVALVSMIIRIVSSAITYARADIMQAYGRLGWSQQQLDALKSNPVFNTDKFLWISLLFTLCYAGFLIWTKRYFPSPAPPNENAIDVSSSAPIQLGS